MNLHALHLIIVFALVIGAFVAFIRESLSPDVVALSVFAILLLTGTIGADDAMKVFSNSAPVTIGAMFVLSAALERTGAIDALARIFLRLAGTSELRALLALGMLTVPLTAFINNTPVVVVFMPVVLALARTTELKASRLLIPLHRQEIGSRKGSYGSGLWQKRPEVGNKLGHAMETTGAAHLTASGVTGAVGGFGPHSGA